MCGRFLLLSEAENKEINNIIIDISNKYTQFKEGEIHPADYSIALIDGRAELLKWGFPLSKSKAAPTLNFEYGA